MKKSVDDSIPDYRELSSWPIPPAFPAQILGIWIYRDGGTVGVTIQGHQGQAIEFFFDRFLGRLCYGLSETETDAAYIKKGSTFEKEIFDYLESARKKLSLADFSTSKIQIFNEYLTRARVYSGV